ncbi:MAG: Maf-like protein [Chlamydiales bacterium]
MKNIILGTQSPRRVTILRMFSLPFQQYSSSYHEPEPTSNETPVRYALKTAQEKGKELTQRFPDAIIITADTVVFAKDQILGKPKTPEAAFQTLRMLSGQWHSVFTGLAVSGMGLCFSDVEETRVLFNPLSDAEIKHYLSALHCWDKAGAYAIQGSGGLAIQKIEGCFYNTMGLPINTLRKLMQHFEIELWDYLSESPQP